MRLSRLLLAALLPLAACDDLTSPAVRSRRAGELTYQLIPSGDPRRARRRAVDAGTSRRSGRANSFNVYGRRRRTRQWHLRATTTSPTFHDAGTPEAQYYVARATPTATRSRNPTSSRSTCERASRRRRDWRRSRSTRAIQLRWSSNAVDASHGTFDHYRVYSTAYDATRGVCTTRIGSSKDRRCPTGFSPAI